MLNHTALPNAPADGRTASNDPLNGPRCRLPVAQSWIGGGPRWTRSEIWRSRASKSSLAALFFRHGGRIDRPSGECRFNVIAVCPIYAVARWLASRTAEFSSNVSGAIFRNLGADGDPDGLLGFRQHQKHAIVRSNPGSSGECRLRRTFASGLAALGVSLPVIEL